jgi:diketogulonate reductase-like aldo/keto reductase
MNRRDSFKVIAAAFPIVGLAGGVKEEPMLSRPIPSSGELLPVIGMGTWQSFDVGASAEERAPLKEVLAAFQELGGKVLDSSPMYGRSEEVAGDMMKDTALRDKLFVATKVWTTGKAQGISQMEDSMRKLRVEKIDLMQVHNLVDVATHLATLREWKAAGRIRYIGITHYSAAGHEAVAKLLESEKLDFVQINYSAGEREAEKRVLPLAKDHGVAVIANRPFAGGDLFSRLLKKPLPDWAAEIDCTSWAQVMLKFTLSHPAVTCAIPATAKVAHLRDNMAAGRGRMSDEALRAKIAEAAA